MGKSTINEGHSWENNIYIYLYIYIYKSGSLQLATFDYRRVDQQSLGYLRILRIMIDNSYQLYSSA